MAFTGRTPESLIPRSDSRNPATTCKGITKSGRPCRRPIDAKVSQDDGVIAVVSVVGDSDDEEIGAAAYFCWQHKDQAERLAAQTNGPETELYPLKERNSIDTLVERLGVLEVDEPNEGTRRKKRDSSQKRTSGARPARRINRPPTWDNVEGPLMSVPSDLMAEQKRRRQRPPKPSPQRKKPSIWASLCCGSADDDQVEPLNKNSRRESETTSLLKYIPPTLSPQLTSTLLAELSKPISPHDDEGYIYIFWLTPDALGPAPSSTASTLLTPPSRPDQGRRTSDVLRQYSVKKPQHSRPDTTRQRSGSSTTPPESDTILLKIGRANNVHRRMNEWTRQCGYSLSLVRYYPYVPSTPSPTPSPQTSPAHSRRPSYQNARPADPLRRVSEVVRKVPHAMRVERLIHLELGAQRVMKKCDACGKEHREWFEVEANREGVKKVDEVVKRWVDWAERANE
ncbi:meiotically up-regulated gene 113-domain-containing protein [Pyrenochaeta sp. MPI-SDFR-AT-0127]|nr:meiotically up-regulated gene 113-domain-containing protein [Pyrenochaeta sp. MPI-SDFR-AT-0127]